MLEWLRTRQELPTDVSGLLGLAQCDFTLLPFQRQGLLSMIDLEEGLHKGGILADDMGMGKTVQLIALICSRPCDPSAMPAAPGGLRACGATLVVVPASLDLQWESEIARLAPQLVVKRFVGTRADNYKPAPGATVPRRLQTRPHLPSLVAPRPPTPARPPQAIATAALDELCGADIVLVSYEVLRAEHARVAQTVERGSTLLEEQPPAWWLQRLRPLLLTLGCRQCSVGARRGGSSPRVRRPKVEDIRFSATR